MADLRLKPRPRRTQVRTLTRHIKKTWGPLRRDLGQLVRNAADPKLAQQSKQTVVYVSRRENIAAVTRKIHAQLDPSERALVVVRALPKNGKTREQGLLYVPEPYVVPGGRFNEIYGWDSRFIQIGLLASGENQLAHGMVENLVYEVEHYGFVLNSNRSWSLNRSQPPLLSGMILDEYARTGDKRFLRRATRAAEKYYHWWETSNRFVDDTGLFRYYSEEASMPPEVAASNELEQVLEAFRLNKRRITREFWRGNRAMRESGFDTTDRFGLMGGDTHRYNPVCLNSMQARAAGEIAKMYRELGPQFEVDALKWDAKKADLAAAINKKMWDGERGLYFDLYFDKTMPTGRRSDVEFATTFLPLWAGIATHDQAEAIVRNLHRFEAAGGLKTSPSDTGHQWDGSVGWAPLTYFAVEGLRRYGYHVEANRIAKNFLTMVMDELDATGEIWEKYNVTGRHSRTFEIVRHGYTTNEPGFGWTNGVALHLLSSLPKSTREQLSRISQMR